MEVTTTLTGKYVEELKLWREPAPDELLSFSMSILCCHTGPCALQVGHFHLSHSIITFFNCSIQEMLLPQCSRETIPLSMATLQGGKVICLQPVSRRAGDTTKAFGSLFPHFKHLTKLSPHKTLAEAKLFCLIVPTALSACVYMISGRQGRWSVPVSLINESSLAGNFTATTSFLFIGTISKAASVSSIEVSQSANCYRGKYAPINIR